MANSFKCENGGMLGPGVYAETNEPTFRKAYCGADTFIVCKVNPGSIKIPELDASQEWRHTELNVLRYIHHDTLQNRRRTIRLRTMESQLMANYGYHVITNPQYCSETY